MPSFTYDPTSRRYRDNSTGRYVTSKEVREAVDTVIDGYQASIVSLAGQLQAGQLSLAEWQTATLQAIKHLHVATAAAANGGFKQMSASDYGYVGSLIKKQYQFLQGFADDIASGKQLVQSGSFLSRVKLYCQSARGSYESVRTRAAKFGGQLRAKRILGAADSCQGCLDEAKRGWQPIEEVAPIGSQECLANCKCEIIYE